MPQPEDVLDSIGKLIASLFSHSKRYTNVTVASRFTPSSLGSWPQTQGFELCWWLGDKLRALVAPDCTFWTPTNKKRKQEVARHRSVNLSLVVALEKCCNLQYAMSPRCATRFITPDGMECICPHRPARSSQTSGDGRVDLAGLKGMDFGARRCGSVPSQLHRGQADNLQSGGLGTAFEKYANGAAACDVP